MGQPLLLQILHQGKPQTVQVRLRPYPETLPMPRLLSGALLDKLEYVRAEAPRKGQKVLYFFFATWCGPCKAAVPVLLKMEQEGIPIVAVSTEARDVVVKFINTRTEGFVSRVALDKDGRISHLLRAEALPTFVLVGAEDKVDFYQRGFIPKDGLHLP